MVRPVWPFFFLFALLLKQCNTLVYGVIHKTFFHKEIRQQNSRTETFLTVSTYKTLRTESKWSQWISLLNFWLWKKFISSLYIILDFKKYFCHTTDKPSILIHIWFTVMQNDLRFDWHKNPLILYLHQVYVNLYLGRCSNTFLWHKQELYFAKW